MRLNCQIKIRQIFSTYMFVWQYRTILPNLNPPVVLKTLFGAKPPNLMTANISGYTVYLYLLLSGFMYDQTKRQQGPSSEQATAKILNLLPNEDIQFGYHSVSGKRIRFTNDGLEAKRVYPDAMFDSGIAYGAHPLKGMARFEVMIVSYGEGRGWLSSIQLGVMRCKKGVPIIESDLSIPFDSYGAVSHCVWCGQLLYNNFVTPEESNYGSVDLHDLREGDRVGLCLSQDGVLEFFVNGESQGIAANNIYTRSSDVYACVDHIGSCYATVITKAGAH